MLKMVNLKMYQFFFFNVKEKTVVFTFFLFNYFVRHSTIANSEGLMMEWFCIESPQGFVNQFWKIFFIESRRRKIEACLKITF